MRSGRRRVGGVAGGKWAAFARIVADRDHVIEGLDQLFVQMLGALAADVDAQVGHRLDQIRTTIPFQRNLFGELFIASKGNVKFAYGITFPPQPKRVLRPRLIERLNEGVD